MSDTAAGNKNNTKKGPKETAEELKELVVGYARQETVEPLKRLGLWVGYGIGGALLVSIGLIIGEGSCGVEDMLAAYDRVAEELESSPQDSAYGPVGPTDLATAAAYVAYQDGGWRPMGAALQDALEGDYGTVRELAESYRRFGAYGPYAAVVCTDSERPMDFGSYREFEQRAIAISGRFGAAIANEMLPCAVWGADPQGTAAAVSAPDAPPILVVGNTGDPATPLENAEAVASSLDTARLLVVDMEGHVAFRSDACATDAIEKYLVDLELPESGTVC